MIDLLLSIFNSKHRGPTAFRFIFWLGLWLVTADLLINMIFPFPVKPTAASHSVNGMARYFEHGRSIEGKFCRMIHRADPNLDDPIIKAGWLDPADWRNLPVRPDIAKQHNILVGGYGMSFNNQLLEAMAAVDGKVTLRLVAGPAAPASHSYRAWELDKEGQVVDVAVFGVLASSLRRARNLTGMTWTYEHPAPYTFPRYQLDTTGNLQRIDPLFTSRDQFREAFLRNGPEWKQFTRQLAKHDASYDAVVFQKNVFDQSALVRLVRRAWANRQDSVGAIPIHDSEVGFHPDSNEIRSLRVMLSQFAGKCRACAQVPVVALFNDRGYGNDLDKVLIPHLDAEKICYLSSTSVAPPNDPSSFCSDGHFTNKVNRELGIRLARLIREELAKTDG
jgi:hypothetical protein